MRIVLVRIVFPVAHVSGVVRFGRLGVRLGVRLAALPLAAAWLLAVEVGAAPAAARPRDSSHCR